MRKNAFTMAELTICIVLMMILAIFAVTNIKPNDNKIRLFVYSGMENISSVVSTLVSDNLDLDKADTNIVSGSNAYDWLCAHVADYFSLKNSANCKVTSADATTVNLTFTNGITIQGLASPWKTDSKKDDNNTPYKYKEFVIDIDGNTKGMNKVGIDRFPMRIYRGGLLEGALIPVDCNSSGSAYCKNSGTSTKVNLAKANEIISYDIYKPESASASKAGVVASYQSYMQADCAIFGGLGYFTVAECSSAGYKANLRCANAEICLKCNEGGNICPMNGDKQLDKATCKSYVNTNNPDQIACFMMLHRPPSGAGMIFDTVADTLSE